MSAAPSFYPPYSQTFPPQQMAPSSVDMNLATAFRSVDLDHSGLINIEELQKALSSTGVPFSIVTADRLLTMFDKNFDRMIDYGEFVELHAYILSMREGFRQRDTNGDGLLVGTEIRSALALGGYHLDESTFHAIMLRFDRHKRGGLLFDDYIELSIFIAQASQTFAKNDPAKRGVAEFSLDTFLAAALEII